MNRYAPGRVAALALSMGLASPAGAQAPDARTLDQTWVDTLQWRQIGPANMGGRITALAVYEADPSTFWASTASGGLLKTTNNGTTFEHQFDREEVVSIGDVAVAQSDRNIVWVGTGEENPRNSSSYGNGVYKSVDGGETWTSMGLRDSFQIGDIAIHPTDPDIVYVGALGRLWGPNQERGLFKTTDGGETWEKILYLDEKTGVMEVKMSPADPDTLLVAAYERRRDGFDNGPDPDVAPGCGLYRTTDGGQNFDKLSQGLPTSMVGRIGINWYRKDPSVVYIILESEKIGTAEENEGWSGLTAEDVDVGVRVTEVTARGPAYRAGMEVGDIVLRIEGQDVLSNGQFEEVLATLDPGETAELEVASGNESFTVEMTRGINVVGLLALELLNSVRRHGGVYRSGDGGVSWTRINRINPRPMYFSQIRVDPSDETYQYVLGYSLNRSSNGGDSFSGVANRREIHTDQHALWIDPDDGRHMILGNDGGLYVTYDRGENWQHMNHNAIGQFYNVAVGPRRDYWVFGGLQDNGTWGAPNRGANGSGAINEDWIRIGGGDGYVCAVDPNDPNVIYWESQWGNMRGQDLRTGEAWRIRPQGGSSFNWKTPFMLSSHNPRTFLTAGSQVFRSLDRGNDLQAISPEIARTDRGNGSAIAESPLAADVLYVGTTDGWVWATQDGGDSWTNLFEEAGSRDDGSGAGVPLRELVPDPRWVSSIEASRHVAGRVFMTLDGHRSDDDNPYVLMTEDHGQTWESLRANLPSGSTRVVREDLENENVLYVGTEFGAWVSVDLGGSWTSLNTNLPTVAVHEFAQHATAGEMVAATHGRSLWILDVTWLRQMTSDALTADAHLYRPNTVVRFREGQRRGASGGAIQYVGETPLRGAQIFYSLTRPAVSVRLTARSEAGNVVSELAAAKGPGLHRVVWNSGVGGLRAGTYQVVLEVDGQVLTQPLVVEDDPGEDR